MRLTAVPPTWLPHSPSRLLWLLGISLTLSLSLSRSCLLFQLSSLCAQRYANYGKLSRLVFALFQARLVPSAASVALQLMPMLISFLLSHLHSPRMHFNCTFSCCCQQLITGNLLKCLRPATTLLSAHGRQRGNAKESRTKKGAENQRGGGRVWGYLALVCTQFWLRSVRLETAWTTAKRGVKISLPKLAGDLCEKYAKMPNEALTKHASPSPRSPLPHRHLLAKTKQNCISSGRRERRAEGGNITTKWKQKNQFSKILFFGRGSICEWA